MSVGFGERFVTMRDRYLADEKIKERLKMLYKDKEEGSRV